MFYISKADRSYSYVCNVMKNVIGCEKYRKD